MHCGEGLTVMGLSMSSCVDVQAALAWYRSSASDAALDPGSVRSRDADSI